MQSCIHNNIAEKSTMGRCLEYDYEMEMKEFFEARVGVKGLVDSGITQIPKIFFHPPEILPMSSNIQLQVPVIDLEGVENHRRAEIVDAIRDAVQTWGCFRMVNHGVPIVTVENILEGVRRFHEQPQELKKEWYTRKEKGQMFFGHHTNVKVAVWRDTLAGEYPEESQIGKEVMPLICSNAACEYVNCMVQLKDVICEILSEALGLRRDYLASIGCMKTVLFACHYHPPCPQPELTWGTSSHTDAAYLAILLENNIDRLQVLHQNQWVDVPHLPGSLFVNIGDFLQLASNDKFKSVTHRVLAGHDGPRISVASFFAPSMDNKHKPYGSIWELLSEQNPAIYKETTYYEYLDYFRENGRHANLVLPYFKL